MDNETRRSSNSIHKPVLLKETMTFLDLKPGDKAIDATLDGGGHAKAILEAVGARGKVLGIEQDPAIIRALKLKSPNLTVENENFRNIERVAKKHGLERVKAVLMDLGLSSWHLKSSGRGFSFEGHREPLDMNMSRDSKRNIDISKYRNVGTAAEILNTYPAQEIEHIFRHFGEVPAPGMLIKKIIQFRKKKRILSVEDFLKALGVKNKKSLARIFQALRIAVNMEIENLASGLEGAFNVLQKGGVLAVISYHSLEDRLVKNFLKNKYVSGLARPLTKKPISPGTEELLLNRSSRSAKLRVLIKTI